MGWQGTYLRPLGRLPVGDTWVVEARDDEGRRVRRAGAHVVHRRVRVHVVKVGGLHAGRADKASIVRMIDPYEQSGHEWDAAQSERERERGDYY